MKPGKGPAKEKKKGKRLKQTKIAEKSRLLNPKYSLKI